MRNKTIDIAGFRQKHNLLDDSVDELEVSACEPQQFFEVITHFDEEEIAEIVHEEPKTENPVKESRPAKKAITIEQLPTAPKLLNPTIHPKIININRIDLLQCDFCTHTGSTKVSMERHMKQLHMQKSAKGFSCKVCLKTFAKKIVLLTHEKIHLNKRPTCECPHCGKFLSSMTAVSNHIKWLHKENREFKCKTCVKMFATVRILPLNVNFNHYFIDLQKGSLKEHEKIHSDVKSHICPICQKTYKTASTLSQHLDTHGKTEYHCSECNLRLNSKRTLKQHMLKHSDAIRFTCEICNAQFKRTKAYKEHLISQHTNIKAYKCDWCEKSFANGANCRKHKKECHPKELAEAEKSESKTIVKLPKIDELLTMSLAK
jgi:RNase P subunit RPR2